MNPQEHTPKHTWDTRAWLIGILGGAFGGSLMFWPSYPPVQNRLNALPHPAFIGHNVPMILTSLGLISLLVLPGLLSGISRRMTFLWGLLPVSLFRIVIDIRSWVEGGMREVADIFWISMLVLGGAWVISSGPVSLFRWLRVRAKRRQEALRASYQAMREAASIPQEGVWPPPPNHNVL